MIAVDTNILVYAHDPGSPLHKAACGHLEALSGALFNWSLPAPCLVEFLRLATHPKVFTRPYTADEASANVERILASPSLTLLRPGPHYAQLLLEAIREVNAVGNLVFDAQIVALCREHGVSRLLTHDRDFDRFKGLQTERLEI
ncbi:MAG: PIN domain-containing protein [Acidobacteriota bacterium]|nr:PIN domain-containing protein [Acidobacteriota bacterium]